MFVSPIESHKGEGGIRVGGAAAELKAEVEVKDLRWEKVILSQD